MISNKLLYSKMNQLFIQGVYRTRFLKIQTNYDKTKINSIGFSFNQARKQQDTDNKNAITVAKPKSINLNLCSLNERPTVGQPRTMTQKLRPLVIIMTWMLARDKHIEKYKQLWFKRGFDVLTVKTTPKDLLVPPIGSQVVAKNLVEYLSEISPQFYREIVIHGFSVGGYQFGEVLLKLTSNDEYKGICQSIKGIILDSLVHTDGCPPGLSRAMTTNPILQPILEKSIDGYLKTTRLISYDNYKKSLEHLYTNPLKVPGLMLYSSDDIVSNTASNERLVERWRQTGVDIQWKCWPQSTHVLHYRDHQLEYETQLDQFLKKLF